VRGARAALFALALAAAGCGGVPTRTPGDVDLAHLLIGRWQGAAVCAPEKTWLANGQWDVFFSPDADFSARIHYFAEGGARYELRIVGNYRLFFGRLFIDGLNLAGPWTVVSTDQNHVALEQGAVSIVLSRRVGT
jgi:hypothetical protein